VTIMPPVRRPMSRRTGASLADVVVIALVGGGLVLMLLTCLSKVRQQARLIECKSNLRQMGSVVQQYARDHGDYPYYDYVGAPPPKERNHAWQSHRMGCGGVSSWQLMLPQLEHMGYGRTTSFGYCPLAHEDPGYRWGVSYEYEMGFNRGNYLYLGPGTYGIWWAPHIMSPRLVDRDRGEYRWHNETRRHIREWCGVHSDGTVRMPFPPNRPQAWSGCRVPLMGEASLERRDKRRGAPHMTRFKEATNYAESGGLMNFLFNDGSVVTYPYSL
jgi:prepilin-type processing-associated H-X9-DG protein